LPAYRFEGLHTWQTLFHRIDMWLISAYRIDDQLELRSDIFSETFLKKFCIVTFEFLRRSL